MRTNTQEAVLSAYIASIGKRKPRDAAQDAAELCRLATSLNRLNEIACNSGLTERQERRKQNLQTRIKALAVWPNWVRSPSQNQAYVIPTLGPRSSAARGGGICFSLHAKGFLSSYQLHHELRVPLPRGNALWRNFVNPPQILFRQRNFHRSGIFFQILPAFRPRNRKDVLSLRHHPSQSKLPRRTTFLSRDRLHARDQIQILLKILSLEPRRVSPVILRLEILEPLEPPRQKSPP